MGTGWMRERVRLRQLMRCAGDPVLRWDRRAPRPPFYIHERAFFMPKLFDSNSIKQWHAEGSVGITARALARAKKLLDDYKKPKLDEGIDEVLGDYIARRTREIPAEDALNTEY